MSMAGGAPGGQEGGRTRHRRRRPYVRAGSAAPLTRSPDPLAPWLRAGVMGVVRRAGSRSAFYTEGGSR
jgi:hypothetical protein